MIYDAGKPLRTTTQTSGEYVSGNTATSLVKRGLLRYRPGEVTAGEASSGFVADWMVEITDEGRQLVAELRDGHGAQ